jgi:LysM repeat protein
MNKTLVFSLAGGAVVLITLALIKKKPHGTSPISTSPMRALPGPSVYVPTTGDLITLVSARFGTPLATLKQANGITAGTWTLVPGQPIKLPPGSADLGARKFAMGTTR